jgi:hypothetical protein
VLGRPASSGRQQRLNRPLYPADFRTGVTALVGITEKNSMNRFFGSGAAVDLVSNMLCARAVNWRPS